MGTRARAVGVEVVAARGGSTSPQHGADVHAWTGRLQISCQRLSEVPDWTGCVADGLSSSGSGDWRSGVRVGLRGERGEVGSRDEAGDR